MVVAPEQEVVLAPDNLMKIQMQQAASEIDRVPRMEGVMALDPKK